jgi:hypothetical protein
MKQAFFVLVVIVLSGPLAMASVSSQEKKVLTDLYSSTKGAQWKVTWDLNTPVYKWYGVRVENGKVVALNLFNNNLQGVLPNSLGNLPYLEELNLAFNTLHGHIPETIT